MNNNVISLVKDRLNSIRHIIYDTINDLNSRFPEEDTENIKDALRDLERYVDETQDRIEEEVNNA